MDNAGNVSIFSLCKLLCNCEKHHNLSVCCRVLYLLAVALVCLDMFPNFVFRYFCLPAQLLDAECILPLVVAISGRVGSETPINCEFSGLRGVIVEETVTLKRKL